MASDCETLQSRKIVSEFTYLLEKSKQLFNGLRDIPTCGHKSWQLYYGRTFDVFSRLWKFQQLNRDVLVAKYDLQRHQIGEIASKIGQLYYHYYLRTSDVGFLFESFTFYNAIKSRNYFKSAAEEDGPTVMVKKMRYFARFIVVCILLRKIPLLFDLVKELEKTVDLYGNLFKCHDLEDFTDICYEVNRFIESDLCVNVYRLNGSPCDIVCRVDTGKIPDIDNVLSTNLSLKQVIIVGSSSNKIKFSELDIDMYRMMFCFERLINEDAIRETLKLENGDSIKQIDTCNPIKYLLYKPSVSQFIWYLSSAFKELTNDSIIAIYFSADSLQSSKKDDSSGYSQGGLLLSNLDSNNRVKESAATANCFYPEDLYPFLRKPLFIIVDSTSSHYFQNFPNLFNQPLLVLCSPQAVTGCSSRRGSMFTHFLQNPLAALCRMCDLDSIDETCWNKCEEYVVNFRKQCGKLLMRCRDTDIYVLKFFADVFLRKLILNYLFCSYVLRMCETYLSASESPSSFPKFPRVVLHDPDLEGNLRVIFNLLGVQRLFLDSARSFD